MTASSGHRVAVVLAGGGSFGAAQAGMLLALAEAGVRPDLVVGTSVGALNGAFFAAGADVEAARRLVAVWHGLRRRDVFPVRPLQLLSGLAGYRDGLVDGTALRRLIERELPYRSFEDTAVPLHAIATEVRTGELAVLSSGPVAPALQASAAIPGVFAPVEIGGRLLMDGALAADLALGVAARLGADVVYAVPTAVNPPARPRGALAMLQNASDRLIARNTDLEIATARSVDLHVLPTPHTDRSIFDFGGSAQLVDLGHSTAARWLAAHADGSSDHHLVAAGPSR